LTEFEHAATDAWQEFFGLATAVFGLSCRATRAIHGAEDRKATGRELRVARILMQVWLSSLNGWVCGVDGPERVDEDLEAAAHLLLP